MDAMISMSERFFIFQLTSQSSHLRISCLLFRTCFVVDKRLLAKSLRQYICKTLTKHLFRKKSTEELYSRYKYSCLHELVCVCVSEKLKAIFWPEQIGTIYSGCINYYVLFFIWYENKLVDSSYTFLNIPSVAIDSSNHFLLYDSYNNRKSYLLEYLTTTFLFYHYSHEIM